MKLLEKVNLKKLENVLKYDNLIFKKSDDTEKKTEYSKKTLYTYYFEERDNDFLKVENKESLNSIKDTRLYGNEIHTLLILVLKKI